MMPLSPPAASANRITAGNQNRRRICLRSPGGAVTIACGVYDFKRETGGFADIGFLTSNSNLASKLLPQQCGQPQFRRDRLGRASVIITYAKIGFEITRRD